MAVKTFTTGEVLTAADTNTYLNNGGLVYVTQVTGTTTAAINVNNCFSATYQNYRIVYRGVSTNSTDLRFRLRASGADRTTLTYYGGSWVVNFAAGTAANGVNALDYSRAGSTGSNIATLTIDIFRPYENAIAAWHIANYASGPGLAQSETGGFHYSVAEIDDGFTLYPAAGTITGIVRVYGYRES